MAANCKFLIYPLLITAICFGSAIGGSSEERHSDSIRDPKQLIGFPRYPYFPSYPSAAFRPLLSNAMYPVPVAAVGVPISKKAGERQSNTGLDGPTYVGIFPVLTGQQACPACATCQNCTECEKCPAPEPSATLTTCETGTDTVLSVAPRGTIDVTSSLDDKPCDFGIHAVSPNTKVKLTCESISSETNFLISKTTPTPGMALSLNTEYTSVDKYLVISAKSVSKVIKKFKCTWISIP